MSQEKSPLHEVAQDSNALKTARAEPIQQQEAPRQSMDFFRSLILDLPVQTAKETSVQESIDIERMLETRLEVEARKAQMPTDPQDYVSLDIPLLIRLFELLREGVKSDVEVHEIVERMLAIKEKGVLTMDDYSVIAGSNLSGTDKENAPQAFSGEPQNESLDFLKKLAGIK